MTEAIVSATTTAASAIPIRRSQRFSLCTNAGYVRLQASAIGASAAAAAEVLVRLHVEPHREECELGARDQQQRDEDHGRGRDAVPDRPQHGDRDPEAEADQRREDPERVEE